MKSGQYLEFEKYCWYDNGLLHREEGPAVEYQDGNKEWWINGRQFSEVEFNHWLEKKVLNEKLQRLPHKNKVKRGKI